jgi:hypothetical protein
MKFSIDEDALLAGLVDEHGAADWHQISRHLSGRTSRQCRERWMNYLAPCVVNGPWTREEEQLLIAKYQEIGPYWRRIAVFFNGRTDNNVKSHWKLMQRRRQREIIAHLSGKLNWNASGRWQVQNIEKKIEPESWQDDVWDWTFPCDPATDEF